MEGTTCTRHFFGGVTLLGFLLFYFSVVSYEKQDLENGTFYVTVWKPGKCPRQLGSIECGYYLQKYIREIVCNPNTPITELFNTKNAYKQEEIDEVQIEWTSFVGRFV
ncbi:uncharacterized protein LOC111023974 isoform X1 [Momordica charantia]|uniref:Uncharacterized protein LOC111023974 isoform X1 n=1 Tax=Momordica charantia TaxID=3673 RepID=A0A6J1DTY8_MOMCH|nr:uncharacterized protein LOC111023974 isoform X1 [Momordica charantia]XP_022157209.1 uncharacterized protein LOC111023974 isoform X1 [Momordica charantia]